jgi:ferric-dicitrate binding protein FerR (iron transport regulator)
MHMRNRKSVSLAILLLVPLSFASPGLANTHSQARAVRLSFVEGTVIARTPGSRKWARAALNMPIEQGVSIATAKHSIVEVQFENGSTLRLGELSRVDFMQMGIGPDGGYINHLKLAVGFTTVNIVPQRHDEYVLVASGASLVPHGKSEFRADLSRGHLRVEVFKGRVQAADSSQSQPLRRNQVLACDYSVGADFQVTDNIQMDDWDRWVQKRDRQASLAAYNVPPPGMYEWESGLMPFGGDGTFPGFGEDGF